MEAAGVVAPTDELFGDNMFQIGYKDLACMRAFVSKHGCVVPAIDLKKHCGDCTNECAANCGGCSSGCGGCGSNG